MSNNILQDVTSRQNFRPSSRRQTFSPSLEGLRDELADSETYSKKDRRALLEEWRRQNHAKNEQSPSISASENNNPLCEISPKKRTRATIEHEDASANHSQPSIPIPRPPSASSSDSLSAVERYRLRRQEQNFGAGNATNKENSSVSILPPQPPSRIASASLDSEFSIGSSFGAASRLPSSSSLNRRLSISSGSAKKARRKTLSSSNQMKHVSLSTPSNSASFEEAENKVESRSDGKDNQKHNDEEIDSIENAGLRSRVQEMQMRNDQLEREIMQLRLSQAPLQNRLRQKEESWSKEQSRLNQEIESLRAAAKDADEHYRSLEHQFSESEEQRKRLLLEIRKCQGNVSRQNEGESTGGSSTWHRQLQNDRDVQDLKQKLRAAEDEINSLKLDKVSLESEVHATNIELGTVLKEFDDLEAEFKELEAIRSQDSDAQIKLEVLEREHIATSAQLNAVCSDLAATRSSSEAALQEMERKWKEETSQLKFELSVMRSRNGAEECLDETGVVQSNLEDEAVLRARLEERDLKITELEAQLVRGEQIRRQMHNKIQELRGNIRVFVRTRPFLPVDGGATNCSITVCPDGETLRLSDKSSKTHEFKFDKVFPPSSGQDIVFEEVSEFVQSALDGYNVVLFCYGMTGSGKTHTMQGSGNGPMRGIIPRAVEQILSQVKIMQSQKWQFTISASFLEIYNEELRDLLASMSSSNDRTTTRQSAKNENKLAIKRDTKGISYVEGLSKIKIEIENTEEGMNQLKSLMAVAARARSVAKTDMNAQSSRSHSVFMLHLRGYNTDTDSVVEGALNLCDLAGSERLDRSGAASDLKTLKETQAINKSLSSLGDVFTSLANKSKHIPYRNSKLTYLLQDCLSGDGKALMFVNLSPTELSTSESLCSLRFAQRVNQIELGKPIKHVHYGEK